MLLRGVRVEGRENRCGGGVRTGVEGVRTGVEEAHPLAVFAAQDL